MQVLRLKHAKCIAALVIIEILFCYGDIACHSLLDTNYSIKRNAFSNLPNVTKFTHFSHCAGDAFLVEN